MLIRSSRGCVVSQLCASLGGCQCYPLSSCAGLISGALEYHYHGYIAFARGNRSIHHGNGTIWNKTRCIVLDQPRDSAAVLDV
ncbi:hypothetical protein C8J56DRAFT_587617 [Mycena floridula]|nr:hypothetical protein C8J56DRAFT_587617 [Mycena floridula]